MALPFSDNFNRADGPIGANWTNVLNSFVISSNGAVGGTGGDWNASLNSSETYGNNHKATAIIFHFGAVGVRFQGTGATFNGVFALYDNDVSEVQIGNIVDGTVTEKIVTRTGVTFNQSTDTLTLEATGAATFSVKKNGTLIGAGDFAVSGAPTSGGSAGILAFSTSFVDDFVGDDLASGNQSKTDSEPYAMTEAGSVSILNLGVASTEDILRVEV